MSTLVAARPRWCTPRTESRKTRGPEIVRTMEMLGYTPHLWQREFADVAGEVGDDGRLVFGQVVALIPRRAGKTVLGFSSMVHRAHAWPGSRIASNMDKATKARTMYRTDWLPLLERSPFAGTYTAHKTLAHERIEWQNGSIHHIVNADPSTGVGLDVDQWMCDEAWAVDPAVEGAVLPAMLTRDEPQSWIISMGGTAASEFLLAKREMGRELVDAGVNTGTAYIEFSAHPDADPDDEDTWRATHPLADNETTIERLRTFHQTMDRAEFAQHFLNIFGDGTVELPRLIAADIWASHLEDQPRHPRARVERAYLAVDAAPDRSSAAVSVAGKRSDGRPQVDVVRHDDGTSWVADYIGSFVGKHRPAEVALDAGGPAGFLAPDIERALRPHRMELRLLGAKDVASATSTWMAAYGPEGTGVHLGQPPLDAAIAGAQLKAMGDRHKFNRHSVSVDICPLVGSALALWCLTSPATPEKVVNQWTIG